ncbi:hypothetical protein NC651_036464 [Populus alba x Populus x berolinensis]|nr:hypothetical protein NC651_036464 [Populus alba x Populus x berolinensis]
MKEYYPSLNPSFSPCNYVFLQLCFLSMSNNLFSPSPHCFWSRPHFCSSPENFTANGPYESNLNKLTSYLYYKAPPTGFGEGSRGHTPDQTYGLALCRGDC